MRAESTEIASRQESGAAPKRRLKGLVVHSPFLKIEPLNLSLVDTKGFEGGGHGTV